MGCLCGKLHSLQGRGPVYPKVQLKINSGSKSLCDGKSWNFPLACSLFIQGAGPIALKDAQPDPK